MAEVRAKSKQEHSEAGPRFFSAYLRMSAATMVGLAGRRRADGSGAPRKKGRGPGGTLPLSLPAPAPPHPGVRTEQLKNEAVWSREV